MIKHIFSYHPDYVVPLPAILPQPLYRYEVLFYDDSDTDSLVSFREYVCPVHYFDSKYTGSLLAGWRYERYEDDE